MTSKALVFKRRVVISAAAALLLFSYHAYASSHIARFAFITEPQNINLDELSGVLTIQAQDAAGNSATTTETTDLAFSTTSSTGEFLNASGDPVRTTMNKGTANRTFYYRDSTSGVHTLKVKATGRDSGQSWEATGQITVTDGGQSSQPASGDSSGGEDAAQSSSASSGGVSAPFQPAIKAYAGEDRTVVVGSLVYFNGQALDVKNEPFENARFWWNFGDGAAVEGRNVTHIFAAAGTYITGLHVSSGLSSASDYLTVAVVPNQVAIVGVVGGAEGFVRLKNPSEHVIDISGWHLSDAVGTTFTLLPHTKINARSEIAFPNIVTGLLKSGSAAVVVYYPNGVKAFESVLKSAAVNSVSVTTAEQKVLLQSPMPARENIAAQKAVEEKGTVSASGAEREIASQNGAVGEFAQISASYIPSQPLFFWFAFGLSILAAGGFLLLKIYGKA